MVEEKLLKIQVDVHSYTCGNIFTRGKGCSGKRARMKAKPGEKETRERKSSHIL